MEVILCCIDVVFGSVTRTDQEENLLTTELGSQVSAEVRISDLYQERWAVSSCGTSCNPSFGALLRLLYLVSFLLAYIVSCLC
jgi:hypothetical protein